ncbi:MAG: DNA polymerase I [Lachnospiraceae bacterium]|nr:DNA polymerase I [Lachnospiraceae bacterium]
MNSKLVLIDGHSILNRAFYGLPDLTNSEGRHTNAVLGFLNIMFRFLEQESATHLLVAFDLKAPTFRHKMFEDYKGTRKPMPAELHEQVDLMKDVLKAMNIPVVTKEGYEADDILGTLSRRAEEDGFEVSIVSGDRDLLQLATDHVQIRIPKTKMSGTIVEDYYASDVVEKYQVTPKEFIDVKGLMGDTADNIPGVPGIGEKTATKLIVQYHSIENAFAHIEEVKPKRAQNNLREYYDQALLSKELATIKLDCDLEYSFADAVLNDIYTEEAFLLLKKLEFKSILKRFDGIEEPDPFPCEFRQIRDFAEAEIIFAEAFEASRIGVSLMEEDGEVLGCALYYKDGEAVFIRTEGFLTQDYLCGKVKELYERAECVATLDLKRLLFYVDLREEMNSLFDCKVAAYLLNPLKDTYLYEDIARDYLALILPSRAEMLKKLSWKEALDQEEEKALKAIGYEAAIAIKSASVLEEELHKNNMQQLYERIELPTIFALADMQKRGIRVEKDALREYGEQLVDQITELEQGIYAEAGEVFNINSPKQLGVVLFEHMGLKGGKKTKTGYSTSVDVLEKLTGQYPICRMVLDYRHLTKLKSTYAEGMYPYIQEDGRIHGKFHQTITATGRISSTDPNLQNIPVRMPLGRAIRKVFVPEEGFLFVDADYSQIELRVLAHFSGDSALIQAYNEGKDIHASTASDVFGIPLDEVTSGQRRDAKAVNFGIVYGISAFGLSQDLNITRKQAQEYIDRYFATYPGVKQFLDNSVMKAKEEGFVETMFHRIRPVPELKSSNFMQRNFGERVAMNSPIQGTAADIIKIAMVNVNMRLKRENRKSRMILQIHDELLIETSIDEVEIVKQILTEEMMAAAELAVPLVIDINTGSSWYEAK